MMIKVREVETLLMNSNTLLKAIFLMLLCLPQAFTEDFISIDGKVTSFFRSKNLVVVKSDGRSFRFSIDKNKYKNIKEGDRISVSIPTRLVEIKSHHQFKKINNPVK